MEEQGKDMWSRSMGRLHTKSEIKDGSLQWHEFCQGKEILYNYMFLSKMKLDISDSLKIWCTDYTARYYELQEQYLKNVIVNII